MLPCLKGGVLSSVYFPFCGSPPPSILLVPPLGRGSLDPHEMLWEGVFFGELQQEGGDGKILL